MKEENQKGWPCLACPARNPAFCTTVLEILSDPPAIGNGVLRQTFHSVGAHETICLRNARCEDVYVLCEGWAFTYFQLPDGRQQIVSFLLGGDLFSCNTVFDETWNLSVRSLTPAVFCRANRSDVKAKVSSNSKTLDRLARICISEVQLKNEILINLGQRSADERIAHLLLSLTNRIQQVSVIRDDTYIFPLRQQDIAHATGLTSVHVGRTIARFRDAKLIELSRGQLKILKRNELERIGRIE